MNFDDILNSLTEGILITDTKGNILFCNKQASKNYRLPITKLLHHNVCDLADKGIIDQSYNELSSSTGKTVTYEQTVNSKKHFICKTIPYFDGDNKIKYIIEQTFSLDELAFDSNNKISRASAPSSSGEKKPQADEIPLLPFKSSAMAQVYHLADNMAPKNINILILGPSGTGKSKLAKRIHDNSQRKDGPFVTINCSTIPENLLESELFGYTKGAFSGASSEGKQGLVELADEGTIFLDEIGEMPFNIQSKLLQLVQDKTYIPVGGVHPRKVDARIIAATNKDLFSQVKNGLFREDLYYRLAVVTIAIPPLKDRPDDVKRLIDHFTHVFNYKHNTDIVFNKSATDALLKYSWPGNIRELENLIEFLILNAEDEYITPHMLPANIAGRAAEIPAELYTETISEDASGQSRADGDDSIEKYDKYESLEDFIESCESKLVTALYPKYNSSYKLAEKLRVSQSKANKMIRKYIKADRTI